MYKYIEGTLGRRTGEMADGKQEADGTYNRFSDMPPGTKLDVASALEFIGLPPDPNVYEVEDSLLDERCGNSLYEQLKTKNITTLKLENVRIDNNGFEYIVKLLEENPNISVLDIECYDDEVDDMYSGLCLEKLFRKKTNLKSACLGVWLPVSTISLIFYYIANNPDTKLDYLEVSFKSFDADGKRVLYEDEEVGYECARNVQMFFDNNKTVKDLDISMQLAHSTVVTAFTESLSRDKTVEKFRLKVYDGYLPNTHAYDFAQALKSNKGLKSLNITPLPCSDQQINDMFIEAMRENTTLCTLDIDTYHDMEPVIADELKEMLKANLPITKSASKQG